MAKKTFIEVGKTGKTFGFDGTLKLVIIDHQWSDLQRAEFVFIETGGNKVPYFVKRIKTGNPSTIQLEDVNSKEEALMLAGQKIYIESTRKIGQKAAGLKEIDQLTDLIGFKMQDENVGPIGEILDVFEYPQQWMAAVNYQEKEVLIPLNDQFISAIDETQSIIFTSLPEGLLGL